jgi:mRNA-degrading endonuclease RelE of RelBE toxin-antitoxin system
MMIETAILKNLEKLPESVKQAVLDYIEFLVSRYAQEAPKTEKAAKRGGLGIWKGKIWMSDDFDEPLEDLKDYM